MNALKLESTFNRIHSGLKSIADPETKKDMADMSTLLAEVRHAQQCKIDGVDEVLIVERLKQHIFN